MHRGGKYANALQDAACSGNLNVIQLLLDKGVDVNTKGGNFDNAL